MGKKKEPSGRTRRARATRGRAEREIATDRSTPKKGGKHTPGRPQRSAKGQDPKENLSRDFPIVGLGASAGGLDACRRFLGAMPADCGMAIVIVQHLDPDHESLMADLLGRFTEMAVTQVDRNLRVEPNHVYVIPPNHHLTIQGEQLRLSRPGPPRGIRAVAIDHFLRSLAEEKEEKAIGVILSGTGTDGTLGIREIKIHGGMTMVQAPETAAHAGMARSALSTGMVDYVLPVEEMPKRAVQYARHAYVSEPVEARAEIPVGVDEVLETVHAHTGRDFRHYKKSMLRRRILRRMGLRHITDFSAYRELLRRDVSEAFRLSKDLLIGATSFFREPEAFEALKKLVLEPAIERKKAGDPLRVWVPGCSTGEEIYSLAMVILDTLDRRRKHLPPLLFGTDLDGEVIDVARAGVYPESIASDVPPRFLEHFFSREGHTYHVNKELREILVFASQNLLSDPPLSKLDLVSCRNLLIYLEPEAQRRTLALFHFALAEEGHLLLGSSEATGTKDLFEPVSKKWRIYRKSPATAPGGFAVPPTPSPRRRSAEVTPAIPAARGRFSKSGELAQAELLRHYAPPSVLVDQNFEILYFIGPLGTYLDIPTGEPTRDLITMTRKGLQWKLRGALRRAMGIKSPVVLRAVVSEPKSDTERPVRITVRPLESARDDAPTLLVSFEDEASTQSRPPPDPALASDEALVRQLEAELVATKEELQSTIEELETSNEELRSSNEEILSMNEELQSSNGQLQASAEELQSLNEELGTVNTSLEQKVNELESANNDIANILSSSDIATLFLDTDLRIRRYTPAATDLMSLIPSDVGRKAGDISRKFRDPDLLDDARTALQELRMIAKQVRTRAKTYARRVLPYRTRQGEVEGVVVTFADVTELELASRERASRSRQQAVVIELGHRALGELDIASFMDRVAYSVATTLEADQVELLELEADEEQTLLLRSGFGWKPGHVGRITLENGPGSHGGYTLLEGAPVVFEDLLRETRFKAPYLQDHGVVSGASAVIHSTRRPFGVLGAYSVRRRNFNPDDVRFLEAVANVLGQAIERRRIEDELIRLNETLEHRVQQRTALVRLLRDVAVIANEAEAPETAFHSTLERICEHTGWPVAHVYVPADASGTIWASSKTWVIRSQRTFGELVEASQKTEFKVGEGLIGRVVAERRAAWIADVREDPHFLRSAGGTDLGIKSAYAVPVLVRRSVVAVMEFFAEEITPISEELGDAIFQVGTQLGQVVERQQSEARYRAVVEDQTECICRFRPDGTLTFLNDACCRLFERSRDELLGTDFFSLVPPEERDLVRRPFDAFVPERNVQSYEHGYRRRDDSIAWLQWTFRASFNDAGNPLEFQGVGRDVTAQRVMSEQLRRVTARLISTEEEERKRLSRELHDQLNQELAMLLVEAESFTHALPVSENEVRERLDDFKSRLTRLSKDVHRLAYQLHPSTLDDLGLAAALRSYANELAKRHDLICSVHDRNLPDRLPADVAACLYRVGQEALRNASRHSSSDRIHLRLARIENRVVLSVKDFGKGFDAEASGSGERRSLGLTSMRERIRLLGGSITIRSRRGWGTVVRAWVPLGPAAKTR